jgi:16S rRNA (cytosine1407-C5)-methyltransferase
MAKRKHFPTPSSSSSSIESALKHFQPLLSQDGFAALQAELERPLFPALRANPLKCDTQPSLEAWAGRYGWQLRPVPFCETGRWVISSETPISQTIEHRMGFYYIQDASSMLPAELFDFDGLDSPLVLDLAASPGGKTTHLLSRTGDRGLVLGNDSSQERIAALRIVLQNWGAVSSAVTHFPGEKFGAWYPDTFDRVLLDAPCSMQGLRPTEGHPLRPITAREQASLSHRQAGLLESALRAVKVGGQVVYATCTLSPEEDEAVLDALLCKFPGAIQVDDLSRRLDRPAPALSQEGGRALDPAVRNAARLWPHIFGTAGFFTARLTRLAPLTGLSQEPPSRSLDQVGFKPLSHREASALASRLAEEYGLDVSGQLDRLKVELWRRGDRLYLLPVTYLRNFAHLPTQSAGMLLGEDAPDGFIPSHEWVARFGMHFTAGACRLPAEQLPAWLRGEDIPGRPCGSLFAGRVVAVVDEEGRLLGRGKVLSGRLKNLLPRRLL